MVAESEEASVRNILAPPSPCRATHRKGAASSAWRWVWKARQSSAAGQGRAGRARKGPRAAWATESDAKENLPFPVYARAGLWNGGRPLGCRCYMQ